ncbi:MAG: TfoX/Sxy family protein [Bacteroidetes bacterium]|nr:TfoX/Sxy family protein [Bacteroidota bacterium]
MAYDKQLAERISRTFGILGISFEEKFMMGGICYMVNDKMCAGVVKNELMARIDPDQTETALTKKGCRLMDFTHKTMKGFVFVDPEGTDMDYDLEYWVKLSLEYNPKAKSSKKKSKK